MIKYDVNNYKPPSHYAFGMIAMELNQYRGYKETLDEFKARVMKMWRES
jgi:hypothetical protein